MTHLEATRRATDAALTRRANLATRALLAGLMRLTVCVANAARRSRARLDPSGGAYDLTLARLADG